MAITPRMIHIASYEWNITDALAGYIVATYYKKTPHFKLGNGIYDVKLTVTTVDADVYEYEQLKAIIISDNISNLLQGDYFYNGVSYTLGMKESTGTGWSENAGRYWMWPESRGAIINKRINSNNFTHIWAMDDSKEYIINDGITGIFKDNFLDREEHNIISEVRINEDSAIMLSDKLTHEETLLDVESDDDELTIEIGLYTDNDDAPVESKTIDEVNSEITFYYSNEKVMNSTNRSVGLKFSSSDFELNKIETIYRKNRKFRASAIPQNDLTFDINTKTGTWITRGNYGFDRGIGKLVKYSLIPSGYIYPDLSNAMYLRGPDGIDGSAIKLTEDYLIPFMYGNRPGPMTFWSTQDIFTIDGIAVDRIATKENWYLYYAPNKKPNDIRMPAYTTFFDFREYDGPIDNFDDYVKNINHYIPIGV